MSPRTSKNIGLNLGPKTTEELASIGIKSLAQLKRMGWEKAMLRLIAKFPERLNLNMISGMIGAIAGKDWRKLTIYEKHMAKLFIKQHKPKKLRAKSSQAKPDHSFRDFVIVDQLASLDIRDRRMFGGYGLYVDDIFFGLIADGRLFLKTNPQTSQKYRDAGMKPFEPRPKMQLKNYYEVPIDVLENSDLLVAWVVESSKL
jgi:DNA transformation protein